uniref:Protein kinase domain-containing protein n=1 Tax=Rhizophora mucronata TaxID=61149 RepID=A0A2P2JDG3_RHIMU
MLAFVAYSIFHTLVQSEVNFLGRLSHPNLVKLQGYYGGDEGLFLVYEFMKKGSLYKHLFRKGSVQPISWNIRMKIAVGTARGLAFLHTLDKAIIHRDFKSQNILLDEVCFKKFQHYCSKPDNKGLFAPQMVKSISSFADRTKFHPTFYKYSLSSWFYFSQIAIIAAHGDKVIGE